ncbi:MAG: TonB-dependent receptor [Gammaproteobacteria bacterium]|nr:TonB-dependent receptor [Gammaproteobacteria bacterium]
MSPMFPKGSYLISRCFLPILIIFVSALSNHTFAENEAAADNTAKPSYDTVTVITGEAIIASGYSTLGDVIRNLSLNPVVNDEFTSTYGTSAFNLRGLGANSSLVLVNGRRLTDFALGQFEQGAFTDVNAVPLAAIDRIEISKASAGASQGAGAIAGVINIVTNTGLDGVSVSGRYGQPLDGGAEETAFDFSYGRRVDKHRFQYTLNYFERDALEASQRDFSENPVGQIASIDSIYGSPPTLFSEVAPGIFSLTADPDCPANRRTSASGLPGCQLNTNEFMHLLPETRRISLLGDMTQGLASGGEYFVQVMLARTETDIQNPPAVIPSEFFNTPLRFETLPVAPATHSNNPTTSPVALLVRTSDVGLQTSEITSQSYHLASGVRGAFADWNWEGSLHWGKNDTENENNNFVPRDQFIEALNGRGGPQGNLTYNPFGLAPDNDPALLDWLRTPWREEAEAITYGADFHTTRPMLQLGNRTADLKIGLSYRLEKLEETIDPEKSGGPTVFEPLPAAKNTDADRDIAAVYAELDLPFHPRWNLLAGIRHDDYSDVGGSSSARLAINYQPTKEVLLRAGFSTGFRAPTLPELNASAQATRLFEILDSELCELATNPPAGASPTGTECIASARNVIEQGNPDLDFEESETYFFSVAWKSSHIDGLEVGVDAWKTNHSQRIVLPEAQFIVDNFGLDSGFVTRQPPATLPIGPITEIRRRPVNGERILSHAADLYARYKLDTARAGLFQFDMLHSFIEKFERTDLTGAIDIESDLSLTAPDIRSEYRANWVFGNHSATAALHYFSDYAAPDGSRNPAAAPEDLVPVDSWRTLDLQYAYRFSIFGGAVLRVGCRNCTDEDPPFATAGRFGFNSFVHDPRGAQLYLSWSQTF